MPDDKVWFAGWGTLQEAVLFIQHRLGCINQAGSRVHTTAYHALSQQALCSPRTSGPAIGFQANSFPVTRTNLALLGRGWPIACRLDLHYGFLFQRASTILERATHSYEKYPHREDAEGDRRLGWTSLVDSPWRMQPCRCRPCNGSTEAWRLVAGQVHVHSERINIALPSPPLTFLIHSTSPSLNIRSNSLATVTTASSIVLGH
jgi:hypothetical protein